MNREYIELVRQIEAQKAEIERLKTLESPRLNSVINDFLLIPGLVGFWPMSSVQRSTGNAYDVSGQGRTLTYNGNPTYNIHSNLTPYIDLDGTGDYLSRADEADLDVLGTETIYAAGVRGLTLGGWFWLDSVAADAALVSKQQNAVAANRSYNLTYVQANDRIELWLNGAQNAVIAAPGTGAWFFAVGKYVPSGNCYVFLDGIKSGAVAGPANLNNSNGPLEIGATFTGTVSFLDGRASLCFLSANALPDDLIEYLYHRSKTLFI